MTNYSNSTDLEGLYAPFQSKDADEKFKQYFAQIDRFVTEWNDNPNNRSKVGMLRDAIEDTKNVLVEDLELSIKRGQLLDETKEKSETLVGTSYQMKKRAKEVKRTMCCRKWWMYILAVVIVVAVLVFLYFLLFYNNDN